ncbi:MAG: hypothetical protein AB7U81_14250 [Thiohalomonadaceae bacterium]
MDRQHPRHPSQGAEGDAADTLRLALAWFAAADAGAPLPAEVQAWHLRGLAAVLAGEADSLDVALGLVHAGQERLSTRYRRLCRDAHLRAAWELLDEPTTWKRGNRLACEIRRFETRVWPRVRGMAEPPARLSALDGELFRAFTFCDDDKMPRSGRGLEKAVTGSELNPPVFSSQPAPETASMPTAGNHPEDYA